MLLFRRFRAWIGALAVVSLAHGAALAQMPQPPEVAAKAYLLLDVTTGQVLASKNPDQPVEPASLTRYAVMSLVSDAGSTG